MLQSGEILLSIPHPSKVNSAGFNPDGSRIATTCQNGKNYLWDASTGEQLVVMDAGSRFDTASDFCGDGAFATGSIDGTVTLWDVDGGEPIRAFRGHARPIHGVAFSPDGERLVSCSVDTNVIVWNVESGEQLMTLRDQKNETRAVSFSPDGRWILTGSDDRSARVWDATTGELEHTFLGHEHEVRSVGFSPDGLSIVTGSSDGTARVWDLPLEEPLPFWQNFPHAHVRGFSSAWRRLLVANDRSSSRASTPYEVWDTESRKVLLAVPDSAVQEGEIFKLSADGRYLVGATGDGAVTLRNVDSGNVINTFNAPLEVSGLEIDDQARRLALYHDQNRISLWDLRKGIQTGMLEAPRGPGFSFAFDPSGQQQVATAMNQTLWIWAAKSGKALHTIQAHNGYVRSAKFSRDGQSIVTAGDDLAVKVWDVESGTLVKALIGHSGRVNDASFSPDGTRIISSGITQDGTARVWDVQSGLEVLTISLPKLPPGPAEFSPDGTKICFAKQDQTVVRLDGTPLESSPFPSESPRVAYYNQLYTPQQRLLWDSAAAGDIDGVKTAIDQGADINALDIRSNPNGRYALSYAVGQDNGEIIDVLIASGADVNLPNNTGFAPLHHAAEFGSHIAAERLIRAGAELVPETRLKVSPLKIAEFHRHPAVSTLIKKAMDSVPPETKDESNE